MITALPKDQGRYLFFDMQVSLDDGRKVSKTVLIYWCPNTLKVTERVSMASTKTSVESKIQHNVKLDADSIAELDHKEIYAFVLSKSK